MTTDQDFRLTEALRLAELGYYVFPAKLIPNEDGTYRKVPLTGKGGFHNASNQAACICTWWGERPLAEIGIACGLSGIAVLDFDVKKGAPGMASLAELDAIYGLPRGLVANTTSGGLHLYYRGDVPNTAGQLAPGVDTRGSAGYVMAPPSTGYTWHADTPLVAVSELPMLPEFVNPLIEMNNGSKTVGEKASQDKGDERANQKLREHEGRNVDLCQRAGMLRRAGLTGEALESAVLSLNEELYEPPMDEIEVRRTVLKSAHQWPKYDWVPGETSTAKEKNNALNLEGTIDLDSLLSGEDLEVEFLVEGMIPKGWAGSIYGPGEVGKSMLLNELAVCLVTGRRFFGRATEGVKVGMFSLEMNMPVLQQRLRALQAQRFEDMAPTDFRKALDGNLFIHCVETMRDNRQIDIRQDVDAIIGFIEKHALGFLVLDTFAAVNSGDENSNSEMAQVVVALRAIAARTGCTICIVHHVPKAERGKNATLRGASALRESLQWSYAMEVVKVDEQGQPVVIALRRDKNNFAPWHPPIYFERGEGGILHPLSDEAAKVVANEDSVYATARAKLETLILASWSNGKPPAPTTLRKKAKVWEDLAKRVFRDLEDEGLIVLATAQEFAGRGKGDVVAWPGWEDGQPPDQAKLGRENKGEKSYFSL